MNQIIPLFPTEFNNYHEPFVGGGSVICHLWNTGILINKQIYLSDLMPSLMNLYKVIKHCPNDMITELTKDCYTYNQTNYTNNRDRFNSNDSNDTENASLLLYLNKTCFNGLLRFNMSGKFNTPIGKYTNPTICNNEYILDLSCVLNHPSIHINECNYNLIIDNVKPNDFIYMDPPYDENFSSYNKEGFDKSDQTKLKEFVDLLSERKVKVAISNSDTAFIRELYKNYTIHEISVKRNISSKASDRNNSITELLIINY